MADRPWRTEKLKSFDNDEFFTAAVQGQHGRVPGTGEITDNDKIADELIQLVTDEIRTDQGVHVETALAILGAVAGFSAQMGIREALIKTSQASEAEIFTIVGTESHGDFFFGDALDELLFAPQPGNPSIWHIVAGAVEHAGFQSLPDMVDLSEHCARTLGTKVFGVPRLEGLHMPAKRPIELLDQYWNPVRNYLVGEVGAPLEWPVTLALTAQKIIVLAIEIIDPILAARIVMEAAIPMAKVHPDSIHRAYFELEDFSRPAPWGR